MDWAGTWRALQFSCYQMASGTILVALLHGTRGPPLNLKRQVQQQQEWNETRWGAWWTKAEVNTRWMEQGVEWEQGRKRTRESIGDAWANTTLNKECGSSLGRGHQDLVCQTHPLSKLDLPSPTPATISYCPPCPCSTLTPSCSTPCMALPVLSFWERNPHMTNY